MLLLRVGKHAGAWEELDPREIVLLEFTLKTGEFDPEVSVYEINVPLGEDVRAWVLRAHSEHCASFLGNPPSKVVDVDVGGLFDGRVGTSEGATRFELTRAAHRYLEVKDEGQLVRLVRLVKSEFVSRAFEIGRFDVLSYVRRRIEAKDPEWLKWKEWKQATDIKAAKRWGLVQDPGGGG